MLSRNDYLQNLSTITLDRDRIISAFDYAQAKHQGQQRKFEDEPYFIHPLRVSQYLRATDEDMIIAGLLHDILEKTDGTKQEIEDMFGHRVAALVDGMSKINGRSMVDALNRVIERYPEVITVRMADRIDNLRTKYKYLPTNRQNDYQQENRQIIEFSNLYNETRLLEEFKQTIESVIVTK